MSALSFVGFDVDILLSMDFLSTVFLFLYLSFVFGFIFFLEYAFAIRGFLVFRSTRP